MKVIVRCANNRVTKADMEREIERLFQENKDLRVQVGHLRDELENAKASVEIQRGFREEMAEEIEALEKELAKSESESSQGMSAVVKFWEEAVKEKNRAEERAEEYHIALMESDCRVDELEKQLEWVRDKNDEWAAVAQGLRNTIEELEDEVDTCRHNIDGYIEGNRRMRAEYEKKLETEQDQTKHWHKKYDDLKENYDELVQLHREWGEEIDRLRKVVIDLQTNRFTTDEFIGMLVKNFMPSTDK